MPASKTIKIDVQAGDIKAGEPGKCWACPVALAMKRHGLEEAFVGKQFIRWGTGAWMKAPESVRRFVADFDAGKYVAPFAFTLEWTP